jgi:hypothetical protein
MGGDRGGAGRAAFYVGEPSGRRKLSIAGWRLCLARSGGLPGWGVIGGRDAQLSTSASRRGDGSSPSPGAWRLCFGAVWRPAAGIREPYALAQPTRSRGYDKEFPSKFAAVAVGQGDTAAPPRRPLTIPMVQRSSTFGRLGLEAASLVIAALAPDAQAESGAVPRAERGSPPICLPRRERRRSTRSRPTKRRALRTRGIFPYPSGSPPVACLVSRHTHCRD